jgi:hypothetical protein
MIPVQNWDTLPQESQIGNNIPANRSKLIRVPFTFTIGDPVTRVFFSDDNELRDREITGVSFYIDKTVGTNKTFIDPSGVGRYYAPDADTGNAILVTLVSVTGEELITNFPYNALANLKSQGTQNPSGRILPINCKIDLRQCYAKVTDSNVKIITNFQLVATFYWSE